MSDYHQWEAAVSPGQYWSAWIKNHEYNYATRDIATEHGIVSVYWQEDFVNMRIVIGGRLYNRGYHRAMSRKWATTLANRFASEIASEAAVQAGGA